MGGLPEHDGTLVQFIRDIARQQPAHLSMLALLGVLTSAFEGMGIVLLYPILYPDSSHAHFLPAGSRSLYVALLFASVGVKTAAGFGASMVGARLRHGVLRDLRMAIHRQVVELSAGDVQVRVSGELVSLLTSELSRVNLALQHFNLIVGSLGYLMVFTAILIYTSWQLTLMAGAMMGTMTLLLRTVHRRIVVQGERLTAALNRVVNRFLETVQGFWEVRGFSQVGMEQQRFAVSTQALHQESIRLEKITSVGSAGHEILLAVALCSLLLVVPWLETRQLLTGADLLTFLIVLYRVQPQLRMFESARSIFLGEHAAIAEIRAFIDRSDKNYLPDGKVPFDRLKRDIVFDAVSYAYGTQDVAALDGVSLRIPACRTTAIVGPSGSGKTTLIRLLARFYDPARGHILIDGVPLASLRQDDWRAHLGIVSQHAYMFSASIRDNIAYGRPEASDAEVAEAARKANAEEFILAFPQQYRTMVGGLGMNLSGGQCQRIALARAVLCDPQILILDEATSALDSLSERLVQEALETFGQGRTIVVIAHRLGTVQRADQIVVLDGGRVLECGTAAELTAAEGLYSLMHALQAGSPP